MTSEIQVSVEKSSAIQRKITVKVPQKFVASRFERGLQEVQKTAKLKGFRQGMVPLPMIKQFYGEDVRHQVFHRIVDETYRDALSQEKIQAVGQPQIDTPEMHAHGHGHDHNHDHDDHSGHVLDETKDFTYIATVEVIPEIEVKGYTGLSVSRGNDSVSDADVNQQIEKILSSNATLKTVEDAAYKAKKGEFVDLEFNGGIVTDQGLEERPGMSGARMIEIGSDQLIEGFEDQLIGMKKGETKTFRIPFPKDYFEKDLAGKESEFTVTVNEIKQKQLPTLDDDFAKQMGFDAVSELKKKVQEQMTNEKKGEVERKLRSDLLAQLIEKNTFECPLSLIQAQTRTLAQEVAQNLKQQGFNDAMIQEALMSEMENLKKRAENQVRASLLLEAIAKKEELRVDSKDIDAEIANMAQSMKIEETKIREFYHSEPRRRDDLEFRLREEKVVKFLLDKAKLKQEK